VSADFMNDSGHLDYSRVEVAGGSVARSVANVAISCPCAWTWDRHASLAM